MLLRRRCLSVVGRRLSRRGRGRPFRRGLLTEDCILIDRHLRSEELDRSVAVNLGVKRKKPRLAPYTPMQIIICRLKRA